MSERLIFQIDGWDFVKAQVMPMLGALPVISVKIERLKRSRQHGSVRMVL